MCTRRPVLVVRSVCEGMGMNRLQILLGLGCILPALAAPAPAAGEGGRDARPPRPAFQKDVMPIVARYCTRCHGGARPRGGMALDRFPDEASALKDVTVWE